MKITSKYLITLILILAIASLQLVLNLNNKAPAFINQEPCCLFSRNKNYGIQTEKANKRFEIFSGKKKEYQALLGKKETKSLIEKIKLQIGCKYFVVALQIIICQNTSTILCKIISRYVSLFGFHRERGIYEKQFKAFSCSDDGTPYVYIYVPGKRACRRRSAAPAWGSML